MSKERKSGRGGARTGAGRKKKEDGLIQKTVRLSQEQIKFLVSFGEGELSTGIRKLVEEKLAAAAAGDPGQPE